MTRRPVPTSPLQALALLSLVSACGRHEDTPEAAGIEPTPLEGVWEGSGDSGDVRLTFEGDSLYFYARDDFQYDTTIRMVPGSAPSEFHATILDSPRTTDSVGETVVAIYELDGDSLRLAAIGDVHAGSPSFDQALSSYRLRRVGAPR